MRFVRPVCGNAGRRYCPEAVPERRGWKKRGEIGRESRASGNEEVREHLIPLLARIVFVVL